MLAVWITVVCGLFEYICDIQKPHKKKSNKIKSYVLDDQFTLSPHEVTIPSNR